MTLQTKALLAVAELARALEGAEHHGGAQRRTIEALQRQVERLAVDATDGLYQAKLFRRQGVKTRAKVRALRTERNEARAQVERLQRENSRLFAEASHLRQDRNGLVKDLHRLHPGYDASRFFDVRSQFSPRSNCLEVRALAYDFRVNVMDLQHIRSEAGIEAIAAAHARATAEGLRPVYVKAIKAAAGIA